MSDLPLASAGIPVFQGENFLDETLRFLRSQDYPNLEIVVCDNASTDQTADIVRRHAAEDPRVRLIVNETNIGAASNYNKVFEVSRGKYFAWNAHDDHSSPDFFSEGVTALDSDDNAVVALPRSFRVDLDGERLEEFSIPPDVHSQHPHVRFRAAARAHPEAIVFGLFRSEAVRRTRLHGRFSGSDRNFVAELMLHGRAIMAGDSEFYLREHPGRSVRTFHRSGKGRYTHLRDAWYAPERENRMVFPSWRRLREYVASVTRTRLGFADSARCYAAVGRLLVDDRLKLTKQLGYDIVAAGFFIVRRLRGSGSQNDV
jgi:glycosyltransferase involved in cell wall biosynthesis